MGSVWKLTSSGKPLTNAGWRGTDSRSSVIYTVSRVPVEVESVSLCETGLA